MSKKDTLEYEPQSAWDTYTTKKALKEMDALAKRYVDFLSTCKTERLVMDYVRKKVEKAGFVDDPDVHQQVRDFVNRVGDRLSSPRSRPTD